MAGDHDWVGARQQRIANTWHGAPKPHRPGSNLDTGRGSGAGPKAKGFGKSEPRGGRGWVGFSLVMDRGRVACPDEANDGGRLSDDTHTSPLALQSGGPAASPRSGKRPRRPGVGLIVRLGSRPGGRAGRPRTGTAARPHARPWCGLAPKEGTGQPPPARSKPLVGRRYGDSEACVLTRPGQGGVLMGTPHVAGSCIGLRTGCI